MRARDRRALASHLENLLVHLLKWRYQPAGRQTGHSWADSIREARTKLAAGLSEAGIASLRFDLRGHGQSDGRQQDLTLASVANDILAAIAHLIDRPKLAGR